MASTREYLNFVLEQLSDLDGITDRTMMGEYIFYYRVRIVGGIYDDRFLVKPTKSAKALMPNASYELPYEGKSRCFWLIVWTKKGALQVCLKRCMMNCPHKETGTYRKTESKEF